MSKRLTWGDLKMRDVMQNMIGVLDVSLFITCSVLMFVGHSGTPDWPTSHVIVTWVLCIISVCGICLIVAAWSDIRDAFVDLYGFFFCCKEYKEYLREKEMLMSTIFASFTGDEAAFKRAEELFKETEYAPQSLFLSTELFGIMCRRAGLLHVRQDPRIKATAAYKGAVEKMREDLEELRRVAFRFGITDAKDLNLFFRPENMIVHPSDWAKLNMTPPDAPKTDSGSVPPGVDTTWSASAAPDPAAAVLTPVPPAASDTSLPAAMPA